MPKIKTIREDIISPEELKETIRRCPTREMQAFVAILAVTGARISEIVRSIKAKDIEIIDEESWSISIVTLKHRPKAWEILPRRVLKLQRDVLFEKVIRPFLNESKFKGDMLIFPKSSAFYSKQLKKANPMVYPHLFRHTLATRLAEFVSPFDLKEWFGWKKIDMAEIYVHNRRGIENIYKQRKERNSSPTQQI
jgi:integrase